WIAIWVGGKPKEMNRLLLLAALNFIILAAATGAALLVGQAQPIPSRLAMLHLTDCRVPCWIGIVPGVTSQEEAIRKVEIVYGLKIAASTDAVKLLYFPIWNKRDPGNSVGVYLIKSLSKPDKITAIRFVLNTSFHDPISLGDLYTLLGPPDSIIPSDK